MSRYNLSIRIRGTKVDIYRLLTLDLLIAPKEVGGKPSIEDSSRERTSNPIDPI